MIRLSKSGFFPLQYRVTDGRVSDEQLMSEADLTFPKVGSSQPKSPSKTVIASKVGGRAGAGNGTILVTIVFSGLRAAWWR